MINNPTTSCFLYVKIVCPQGTHVPRIFSSTGENVEIHMVEHGTSRGWALLHSSSSFTTQINGCWNSIFDSWLNLGQDQDCCLIQTNAQALQRSKSPYDLFSIIERPSGFPPRCLQGPQKLCKWVRLKPVSNYWEQNNIRPVQGHLVFIISK